MQAIGVIPSRHEVRLVDQPPTQIAQDAQVKIRSLEVGICGTDKEICSFVYGSPPEGSEFLVLGHESLGEVVEVGTGVSRFKRGDLVVPSVRRPCQHQECLPCRNGRQDFCATGDFTERGIKMRHGYMTECYVELERYLTPMPAALRDVGVLTEPLTVAQKGIAQAFEVQQRLPWVLSRDPKKPGDGLRAVVLGAGPVGILGAMALIVRGFKTYVYSRSPKPNKKAELVEAIGAEYISSRVENPRQLAERVGNIDLVYEAVGAGQISFEVLQVLGINGIFIFTGIPTPRPAVSIEADQINRNLVLKNQVALGTVNASLEHFQNAVDDLGEFARRWPQQLRAVITGRYSIASYRELLLGDPDGIKNVITLE
jgi:threonine dehydrogenase-like Zn-dependent dehydrogenase